VVDGVSWRVLLPELAAAYAEAAAGRTPAPEPPETSFRTWALALERSAADPAREAELPMWREILADAGGVAGLPLARPLEPGRDRAGTIREHAATLPTHRTAPLLTTVPAAFGASVNDVLLTALALAVADVRRRVTGDAGRALVVALEGHGREEGVAGGLDLSRTVGWFTNVFPVRLDHGGVDLDDALAGGPAAGAAIERVRDALRAVPDAGLGYGMLRYLNPRTAPELAALGRPHVEFNYMGRLDYPEATDWAYAPEAEAADSGADDDMPETYCLIVNAQTEDRDHGPELGVSWAWPDGVLARGTVEDLAATWFRALDALSTRAAAITSTTPTEENR
jgi:non-ribosomal peptide synthase protein (TIGR01720 family)